MFPDDKTTKRVAIWFLAAIAAGLLGGWAYAVKTSWQNETRLSSMSNDLTGIKRSLIRISLKIDPHDPSIADELLSGTALQQGIGHFSAGEFPAAYAAWEAAAAAGDEDSAFAIATATAELKNTLKDSDLAPEKRQSVQHALRSAPDVVELNGEYMLKEND